MGTTKVDLGAQATAKSDVDLNSQKITGLAAPTAATDAATKAYADAAGAGLDVKESCRCGSVANVPIATDIEAGDVIDGVTLVEGDRVLLKDQTAGEENGIYVAVAAAAGAASRSTDADVSAEVTQGMFCFVAQGTVNGGNGWLLTTANPITLNTTVLAFTQFSGAGQITAGTGMTKTGNTLDAIGGDGITANADDLAVDADGSTLTVAAAGVKVSDAGVTKTQVNTDVAGNGIAGGAGTALSVDKLTREVPTGAIDGANTAFTLANTPAPAGSEMLFLNGLLMNLGAGNDYTISGTDITMVTVPQTGDILLCSYFK